MFHIHPEQLGEPIWQLPDGPRWRVDGPTIGLTSGAWLVRRLEATRPSLEAFAVLGRAAGTTSAFVKPAMAWKRDNNHLWLATPEPEGRPLNGVPDAEPIQRWLELADGVSNLHARGLVHGCITPEMIWTGSHLTLIEPAMWVASAKAPPTKESDIAGLTKLLEVFTASAPNESIATILAEVSAHRVHDVDTLARLVRSATNVSQSIEGTLRVVALETPTNPRYGEGIKFRVINPSGTSPLAGGFFWAGAHGDVYDCLKGIWEGAELGLVRPHFVSDSEGRRFLTAKADTLPILEPHWFTSVTDVIKSEGCVSRYFVDVRDDDLPGKPLVLGNVLHGLLEDLMARPKADFDTLWGERARGLGFTALAAGLSDRHFDAMREEARAQFVQLQAFAAGRDHAARYSWDGESVEVSRFSNQFGIEGRIDLVTEDPKRGLNIIELKTGSVREEHTDQVRAYKLLWDPYAKAKKTKISGYLLYSREGTVRTVDFDNPEREATLLRNRNRLVTAHHQLAHTTHVEDALPHYGQVPENCRSNDCRFRRKTCEAQCQVLGLGTHIDAAMQGMQTWWRHFHRLIQAEHWAENAAFGDSFRSTELDERIARGRCIPNLTITAPPADGVLTLSARRLPTLSPGAQVIAHRGDASLAHLLRGTVVEATQDTLVLRVPSLRDSTALPTQDWYLELVPSRMGYRASQQNLYRTIASKRPDLHAVLTGTSIGASPTALHAYPNLNAQQCVAVSHAVGNQTACLIEGPPGTGKTTVIAHAVQQLQATQRMLLCAQTNTALDTVLERLAKTHVPFLRVGSAKRSLSLAAAVANHGGDVAESFSDDLAQQCNNLTELEAKLRAASVIACTVYSVSSSDVLRSLERLVGRTPFDVVIIDEATQLTEPAAVGALARAQRFVLVGDPKQLPPIVQTNDLESAPDDRMHLAGLDQSLFERLLAMGTPSVRLEEQYRMNDAVMSFSNRAFYGDELRAAEHTRGAQLKLSQSPSHAALRPEDPVVFVDVHGHESNRTNAEEAALVAELVTELLALGIDANEIGVISPFRAQVELLRQSVRDQVECDTVERFQGGEREVILISLVRTENAGAFITDERRLNVALTRARTKVIVVGHADCLRVSPLLRTLIDQPETTRLQWP
ncbi:MAG: AAA domain-containing protein [bacterium]